MKTVDVSAANTHTDLNRPKVEAPAVWVNHTRSELTHLLTVNVD